MTRSIRCPTMSMIGGGAKTSCRSTFFNSFLHDAGKSLTLAKVCIDGFELDQALSAET